jgi:hypothetical protein
MGSHRSSCRFHLTFTQPVVRRSGLTKTIAENLKAIAKQVVAADVPVATFFAASLSDNWTIHIGTAEEMRADNALIGWADRDDEDRPTVVLGWIDSKYVSVEAEARDALSDLGQLVEGATNLLIVDLSGRSMDAFTLRSFEAAAAAAGAKRSALSAVLLTARSCRLRPAPSTEFESCAWYRAIPNPGSTASFSREELALLEAPGLVVSGNASTRPSVQSGEAE